MLCFDLLIRLKEQPAPLTQLSQAHPTGKLPGTPHFAHNQKIASRSRDHLLGYSDHDLPEGSAPQVLTSFPSLLEGIDLLDHRLDLMLIQKLIQACKRTRGTHRNPANRGLLEDDPHQIQLRGLP